MAGGSGGWVGPWALLWRHCTARWHTAARVRAVRFVIRPAVCSKASLLQYKKVSGRAGSPEWKGSCYVSSS